MGSWDLIGLHSKAFSQLFHVNSVYSVLQSSKSEGAQKEVKYEPFSFPDGEYREINLF